jgi:hypothetical protein
MWLHSPGCIRDTLRIGLSSVKHRPVSVPLVRWVRCFSLNKPKVAVYTLVFFGKWAFFGTSTLLVHTHSRAAFCTRHRSSSTAFGIETFLILLRTSVAHSGHNTISFGPADTLSWSATVPKSMVVLLWVYSLNVSHLSHLYPSGIVNHCVFCLQPFQHKLLDDLACVLVRFVNTVTNFPMN